MPRATMTSKGQVTIPKPVRDNLGLSTGDVIDFVAGRGGGYMLHPARSRSPLQGLCDEMVPKGRRVTVEQMNAVAAQVAAERFKSRRQPRPAKRR